MTLGLAEENMSENSRLDRPPREVFEEEVRENHRFFLEQEFGREDSGKFALLKSKQLIAVPDTRSDAIKMGEALFKEDRVYSAQQIAALPADLGYMPHALYAS